ncbi:MAG: sigma-70 family RNA polymerase sigma factor [Acutalibacter sp.]|nr:sigma-70 family RNA polymerase sigma factor [Acutalibacter sp.]
MRLPLETLAQKYQISVYRAAFSVCKNPQDAEDVTQETFLSYHRSSGQFESEEHIRAWLLRVAINKGKNLRLSFWARNRQSLEDYLESLIFEEPEDRDLFTAVMALPEKYRTVIHLFYYEDYTVKEIAKILGAGEGTVKTRLHRGREMLKNNLKEGQS